MKEIAEILGRLIALLTINGILTDSDRRYIIGEMSEAEWIEEAENDQ